MYDIQCGLVGWAAFSGEIKSCLRSLHQRLQSTLCQRWESTLYRCFRRLVYERGWTRDARLRSHAGIVGLSEFS